MKSPVVLPKVLWLSGLVLLAVVTLCLYLMFGSSRNDLAPQPVQVWLLQDGAVQSPQQARQIPPERWQLLAEPSRPLGYGLGTLWFRLVLEPRDDYVLSLDAPFLDEVDFYLLTPDEQVSLQMQTGDQRPFANRLILASSLMFPVQASWQQNKAELLVRLNNVGQSVLPLRYVAKDAALQQASRQQMLHSFFLGILLFAALLAVLLATVTRQHSLHLFSGLLLCITAVQAELNGLPFQWLWPEAPGWNRLTELCLPLAIFCCSGFVRSYFQLSTGWLVRLFGLLMAVAVLLFAATQVSAL
ncbi:MAG: 7TM diverse intracellular signaling domain-containing protein, partial [Vogesella sp.]|uniref:7TM diverse intracellular signaling domain-containing protein n=1 Tax=Vogesella sp. TaxID=1904252 RepID=UPI003F381724